jgi:hypothetical protein
VCATLCAENGTPGWVTPVVVLWVGFPAQRVEHDGVVYVHGDGDRCLAPIAREAGSCST